MNRQEAIKKLYFECKYNQKEIAETLEISNKYVSKVLLEDSRYKEEKEKRKLLSQNRHRQKTIDYIKNKRKLNMNTESKCIYRQVENYLGEKILAIEHLEIGILLFINIMIRQNHII